MLKLLLALACDVVILMFSLEVQALPRSSTQMLVVSPEVIPIRDFCGLGYHRGPGGYCVRNGVPYGYVAPVVVGAPSVVVVPPRVTCPYPYHYDLGYGGCIQ